MTTLSDISLKNRIIPGEKANNAKELFKKKEWEKIGNKILIYPYDPDAVGPFSYDLSIGNEAILFRNREKIDLKGKKGLKIDPGATVLVLTREYIGLPKNISGLVQSRARILFDGLTVFSTKVDPTWHGKLGIVIKNNLGSCQEIPLNEPFCTLIFYELDKPTERVLTKDRVSFLGQESLESVPRHIVPWIPKRPEAIRSEDLDKVVNEFGPPFDTIRGMFSLEEKIIKDYVEQDWGKHLLREYGHEATSKAFSYLKWLTGALVIVLLGMVVTLVIAVLSRLGL